MADDVATFGAPVPPRRRPRWGVVIALLVIAGLGAWFAWNWPTPREIARAVNPEAHGRALGTAGERVPGATGAPSAAEVDTRSFPMPTDWDRANAIAYLDKRPLYLAGSQPEAIADADMMIEATTDEGRVNGGYHLFVPKDAASGTDVSARYYYLRVAANQYVRVTEKQATP